MRFISTFTIQTYTHMNKLYRLSTLLIACGALTFGNIYAQQKSSAHHVSLLTNTSNVLPFKKLDDQSIIIVGENIAEYKAFVQQVNRYIPANIISYSELKHKLSDFNTVIFVGTSATFDGKSLSTIKKVLSEGKQVVICQFGNSLKSSTIKELKSLGGKISFLTVNDAGNHAQENMAMSLFGGLPIKSPKGDQEIAKSRLQYNAAGEVNLNIPQMTKKIDAIAEEAIREKATPGLVVMVVKDGKVILEKAYGYHTYENKIPTKTTDIFDLASVSKIAGTTPVVMNLYDKGLLKLDSTMGFYLPDVRSTDKSKIPLRSVLLHEAGFTPFIPFYKELKTGDLQRTISDSHQVKVADSAYLRNNYYHEVMWPQMMNSGLKTPGKYVYSDISMYVMKEVSEKITNESMDKYVTENFYQPIGMWTAGYNPRNRYDKDLIVPTEHDTSFRKVLLEGYVHDQGAAMAGGLAGHAGLFATANDLAIYGQLLLNRGEYGGVQYFKPETIDLFTSNQSKVSRRGLGFDRFDPNPENAYPSKLANKTVYGHTGYTGTCIWVDPQNQLVYIFLSNRVHPQVSTKLLNLNIRSRIQDAIYETINEAK